MSKTAPKTKKSVRKRTVNSTPATDKLDSNEGAPFNDQDVKRRSGRYTGAGEITRRGIRGK
jgi:hypothetical protein